MSYSVMPCGILLPADMVTVSVTTGGTRCLVSFQSDILQDQGVLARLDGQEWDTCDVVLAHLFTPTPAKLVVVSQQPDAAAPSFPVGEARYGPYQEFSALAHCFRALLRAYRLDFRFRSFVYAAVALSTGGIQEFSRDLPMPKQTLVPDHVWKLLLVMDPVKL